MFKVKSWFKPLFILCLLFPIITFANSGLDWLGNQTNSDGSYGQIKDVAVNFQSTSETLRTFTAIHTVPVGVADALSTINNQTYNDAEYLARKIIAYATAESVYVTSLVLSSLSYYRAFYNLNPCLTLPLKISL